MKKRQVIKVHIKAFLIKGYIMRGKKLLKLLKCIYSCQSLTRHWQIKEIKFIYKLILSVSVSIEKLCKVNILRLYEQNNNNAAYRMYTTGCI